MQYTEFIHPEDAAALKALKAIPMLSTIVKKAKKCPKCGVEVKDGQKFCSECGHELK